MKWDIVPGILHMWLVLLPILLDLASGGKAVENHNSSEGQNVLVQLRFDLSRELTDCSFAWQVASEEGAGPSGSDLTSVSPYTRDMGGHYTENAFLFEFFLLEENEYSLTFDCIEDNASPHFNKDQPPVLTNVTLLCDDLVVMSEEGLQLGSRTYTLPFNIGKLTDMVGDFRLLLYDKKTATLPPERPPTQQQERPETEKPIPQPTPMIGTPPTTPPPPPPPPVPAPTPQNPPTSKPTPKPSP